MPSKGQDFGITAGEGELGNLEQGQADRGKTSEALDLQHPLYPSTIVICQEHTDRCHTNISWNDLGGFVSSKHTNECECIVLVLRTQKPVHTNECTYVS